MESKRGYRLLVFYSAFACLLFELVVSRLADFHLGSRNSFLALPITFFGLALGSLHVHFQPRIVERFDVRRSLLMLTAVAFFTLMAIYALFSRFIPVVWAGDYGNHLGFILWKTLIFIVAFMAPFYIFGRILAVCYQRCRDGIGPIYSADFFGAALGCFLTPLLFHFLSLPEVVTLLIAIIGAVLLACFHRSWIRSVVLACSLLVLLAAIHTLVNRLEHGMRPPLHEEPIQREVASRWNEFSRVQLVHFEFKNPAKNYYSIVHDNGISFVHVTPYVPGLKRTPKVLDALELPFILGRKTDDILVMFAGCGSEMIQFNEYTGGKASITGVEINGLCRDIAMEAPELAGHRLAEFYRLPNIDLRIAEGRSFLMRNQKKYDVIFIGSSASLSLAVTGHTRKFLYTVEAFNLYLDALKPGGLLIFDHQPLFRNLDTLKTVFAQRGIESFPNSVMLIHSMFGRYQKGSPDVAIAPGGFTPEDTERLMSFKKASPEQVEYAPFRKDTQKIRTTGEIFSGVDPKGRHVVDDRPYFLELDLSHYSLWPDMSQLSNETYYMSWVKITTLIVLCGAAAVFIVLASFSRSRRLPPSILLYLLLTGFFYMLAEVAYIAKLELFLQNPLVSMACVVSIFLLTSGLGSLTYEGVAGRLGMRLFPFLVAALALYSIAALEFLNHSLLGLPLPLKLLATAAAIGPVGMALGMFYPFAVRCLVKHDHENAVAVTYGISTLASVIGATYAMTFMLKTGFNTLLIQAAAGYLLLGVLVLLYGLAAKKNLLA